MTTPPNNSNAISVATTSADNTIIKPQFEVKKHTIRLHFLPCTKKGNDQVASSHYKLIRTMKAVYPDIKIFNNNGKK